MTTSDVSDLLKKMESDRVERTVSNREYKICTADCYKANDLINSQQPGYLLYGVDNTGEPAGMTISDEDILGLGNIRANGNIQPLPHIDISEVFHFPEGDVVVVTVHPADFPPVRHQGKIWVRIGARKQAASEQEERRLMEKRASTARNFDQQACLGASLEDIAQDSFKLTYLPQAIDRETLEKNNRTVVQQLSSVGLWEHRNNCPTNGGILLVGINPLNLLSGAYVQYVKYDGANIADAGVESEKQFSGALVTMLPQLEEFIKFQIVQSRPVAQGGFQEKQVQNYPFWALRELVMNAVMHRDYGSNAPIRINEFSDRIEIQNSGGLFGDATPANFPHASDYRNPIVAGAMRNLGYVNRFNYGVMRAQEELRKNGSPEAVFDLSLGTKFSVTLFKHDSWIPKS